MYKEKKLKVQGEVENIKKQEEDEVATGDRQDSRLPRLSSDLMKWKGGAAERRRVKQDRVHTSVENALAKLFLL